MEDYTLQNDHHLLLQSASAQQETGGSSAVYSGMDQWDDGVVMKKKSSNSFPNLSIDLKPFSLLSRRDLNLGHFWSDL